jgi:hypothetical protein
MLASLADRLAHVAPASGEMSGYDTAVALDRIASIEDVGPRATYCVTVDASNLFVTNGVVTGNCLRNLRNFDEAGISDEVAARVIAKLADPAEVARSRQLPFRFYSAYLAAPSLRWGHALDKALSLATQNVPKFGGRTLVLVDTSASMSGGTISARSTVTPVQAAALFGVSLAAKGERVDLCGFADGVFLHGINAGASVLKEVGRFCGRIGEVGHGTQIAESIRRTYRGHDRVVILSDMQTMNGYGGNVTDAVPKHIPMYGFNLQGYRHAVMPTGTANRHEFGGMSDATFKLIPLLESGNSADWPF